MYLLIINNLKIYIHFFSFLFFPLSKHKANTTELHLKVRPTCFVYCLQTPSCKQTNKSEREFYWQVTLNRFLCVKALLGTVNTE